MMHFQWVVIAMLGVTGLWVVMTKSEPDSNHIIIKPYGPKMCGNVCSHRTGCSGYLYSPHDLSCRLIVWKTNPGELSLEGTYYLKVRKDKQRLVAERNLTCLRNSKVLHTRRNILKCKRNQLKPSRRMKYTRLLILPNSRKFYQGRQLYLHNNSVVSYPHINIRNTLAVAYIITTKKLIISALMNGLFIASLDRTGKETTIFNRRKAICGITVDEENHLVFLSEYQFKQIHVMTTECRNSRRITRTNYIPGQIAADPQKQVIYVVGELKGIFKYTYKGEPQGAIHKGHMAKSLLLTVERDILYYAEYLKNSKSTLFKMFLSNLTSYGILTKFETLPGYFDIYSNKLYAISFDKRNTLNVLSDSGKELTTINIGYRSDVEDLVICAIP